MHCPTLTPALQVSISVDNNADSNQDSTPIAWEKPPPAVGSKKAGKEEAADDVDAEATMGLH